MMLEIDFIIDVSQNIHSLMNFKRNSSGLMRRMKKTRRPFVLTVKGKAEAVVMDPGVYQKLADYHDAVQGIRLGLLQAKRREGRTVDDVFDAIDKKAIADTA